MLLFEFGLVGGSLANKFQSNIRSEWFLSSPIFQLAWLINNKYACLVLISLLLPRLDCKKLNEKAKATNEILKKGVNPMYMHTLYTYRVLTWAWEF